MPIPSDCLPPNERNATGIESSNVAAASWIRVADETDATSVDLELIRAVARQEQQAFKILYERYAPRLASYLLKMLKRPDQVDEVINDVMLAVWQNAGRFDPTQGRLLAWLFGIAHYKGLQAMRQTARSQAEIPLETWLPSALDAPGEREETGENNFQPAVAPHDPERTVMGWELGQAIRWALDRLSSEHRTVIELTFGEDLSYPEIATILDCPLNTVKTRMFHARQKLAQLLAQCGHADFATARE
jgi:RNA polymerase sigma-70 factor (ECF subfamily)